MSSKASSRLSPCRRAPSVPASCSPHSLNEDGGKPSRGACCAAGAPEGGDGHRNTATGSRGLASHRPASRPDRDPGRCPAPRQRGLGRAQLTGPTLALRSPSVRGMSAWPCLTQLSLPGTWWPRAGQWQAPAWVCDPHAGLSLLGLLSILHLHPRLNRGSGAGSRRARLE